MNTTHLLRAPTAPPAPVAWPPPTLLPPAAEAPPPTPAPEAVWAPPPPAPEAPPQEAPRSRRGLILPLLAAVVLVLGVAMAVGGLAARSSAQAGARDATEQLATTTSDRDRVATSLVTATADMNTAQAMAEAATLTAQQALAATPAVNAAADRLIADLEQMASAEAAFEVALASGDVVGANAAVDVYNAALADAGEAWAAFEDAAVTIITAGGGGITITLT